MKLLVTGAKGLLGTTLANYLDFVGIDISDCDIRDFKQVERIFKKVKPDLTVHLAAIVDATDKDKKLAWGTNVVGTENVALCSKKLLYISSDYVFDGEQGNYKEDDIPNPQSFYGTTKLLGEQAARLLCPKTVIVRTSFKPIPYKHDQVPVDMYSSADYVHIIAYNLAEAIKNFDKLPPIIHIATERKSLYDLAVKTKPQIKKINLSNIAAKLPKDCSLNTELWKSLNLE